MSVIATTPRAPRRFARVALTGLALVAVAGCSSGGSHASSTKKDDHLQRAASSRTTSTTVAPSTTTAAAAAPPCTVIAATAALPAGTTAVGVVCAGGWASGPDTNGSFDAAYLLRADGAGWRTLSTAETQQACAAGNPMGIPSSVLAQSPCEVS